MHRGLCFLATGAVPAGLRCGLSRNAGLLLRRRRRAPRSVCVILPEPALTVALPAQRRLSYGGSCRGTASGLAAPACRGSFGLGSGFVQATGLGMSRGDAAADMVTAQSYGNQGHVAHRKQRFRPGRQFRHRLPQVAVNVCAVLLHCTEPGPAVKRIGAQDVPDGVAGVGGPARAYQPVGEGAGDLVGPAGGVDAAVGVGRQRSLGRKVWGICGGPETAASG